VAVRAIMPTVLLWLWRLKTFMGSTGRGLASKWCARVPARVSPPHARLYLKDEAPCRKARRQYVCTHCTPAE
jgi:hypothetical protein